eukprot:TRINITY_DN2658_c0_g1_i2.p1 TRINITY_DN2658_c0_g1~~TRINITY_DN2658_c0_g1_i2.p1  ORF type:complete len:584 (+),score=147.69 TRINITY_DN2658_c0_g1_i2:42-1754(+)
MRALSETLRRVDGRGYRAYGDALRGARFEFERFTLVVDHVQADPFAAPSRLRVRVPLAVAQFPQWAFSSKVRSIGSCDFLTRLFYDEAHALGADVRRGGSWSGVKGGDISIERPTQQILERTSIAVTSDAVEARFTASLPAQGRTILGRLAEQMLMDWLPRIVDASLLFVDRWGAAMLHHVDCYEDQECLRGQLRAAGLVAFVRDGAVLPRESGASDFPLHADCGAVPFASPPERRVSFTLPHYGTVQGMGVPVGVTLIVGGGFHGKSTLLRSLEYGVYSHVPGDGREYVVSDANAIKVRAEDGRAVRSVDISGFIGALPYGRLTTDFSTTSASGSTSQAANIAEALEVGATTLLLDEDTSATNFLVRDSKMRLLVPDSKEPITPFVLRVRSLFRDHGVSTVLVLGGCGDYFAVADTVLAMDAYQPADVTTRAHEIGGNPESEPAAGGVSLRKRLLLPDGLDTGGRPVRTHGLQEISYGEQSIDLRAVSQLVDECQTRYIALLMQRAAATIDVRRPLAVREALQAACELELDAVGATQFGHPIGDLARPRLLELACAVNRLRTLLVRLSA